MNKKTFSKIFVKNAYKKCTRYVCDDASENWLKNQNETMLISILAILSFKISIYIWWE